MKVEYLDSWAQRAAEILQEASEEGKVVSFVQLDMAEGADLLAEMMPDADDAERLPLFREGGVLYAGVSWQWPTLEDGEVELKLKEQGEPDRLGRKVHVDVPPAKDT